MKDRNDRYHDRFGYEWEIKFQKKRGKPTRVVFTCGDLELVGEDEIAQPPTRQSEYIKELFCDAERLLVHADKKWYVGYRQRIGRGGHATGGTTTRFRCENGEVRYAGKMLHFRHMPEGTLREHLVSIKAGPAAPARSK